MSAARKLSKTIFPSDLAREQDIQREILTYLRTVHSRHGWWWVNKLGAAARYGSRKGATYSGTGDIMGCYFGKHVELEVKTISGRQSDSQKAHEAEVKRAGGIYHVVRSVEDVEKIMEGVR